MKYDVSIIVLTYNPNKEKLFATIRSIICQKNINFEIVISDDGSEINFFKEIDSYLGSCNIDYQLIRHEENKGTVYNFYDAIKHSEGEYNYVISPGDLIYDESVVSSFYYFATNNKIEVCFGNAVCYSYDNKVLNVNTQISKPYKPYIYDLNKNSVLAGISFFFGNSILGAGMLRTKRSSEKYLKEAIEYAKFLEDESTNSLAIMDGEKIIHYDNNVIWYESNDGISNSDNQKWDIRISKERENIIDYLKCKYCDNSILNIVDYSIHSSSKITDWCWRLVHYPYETFLIICSKIFYKKKKKNKIYFDVKILEKYLDTN